MLISPKIRLAYSVRYYRHYKYSKGLSVICSGFSIFISVHQCCASGPLVVISNHQWCTSYQWYICGHQWRIGGMCTSVVIGVHQWCIRSYKRYQSFLHASHNILYWYIMTKFTSIFDTIPKTFTKILRHGLW